MQCYTVIIALIYVMLCAYYIYCFYPSVGLTNSIRSQKGVAIWDGKILLVLNSIVANCRTDKDWEVHLLTYMIKN